MVAGGAQRRRCPSRVRTESRRGADQDLWEAIGQAAPVRQRAVVVLRFYEDLSEADTAELLGARWARSRAMARGRSRSSGSTRALQPVDRRREGDAVNSDDLRLLLAERAADVDDVRVDRVDGVHAGPLRASCPGGRRRCGGCRARRCRRRGGHGAPGVTRTARNRWPLRTRRRPTRSTSTASSRTRLWRKPSPWTPGTWMVEGIGPSSTPSVILDVPSGYLGSGGFLVASDRRPLREVGYWAPTTSSRSRVGADPPTPPAGSPRRWRPTSLRSGRAGPRHPCRSRSAATRG